jgi:hypothetical protein
MVGALPLSQTPSLEQLSTYASFGEIAATAPAAGMPRVIPAAGMISGTVTLLKLVAGGNPSRGGPSAFAEATTVGELAVREPEEVAAATVRLAHPATPISTDAPQINSRVWLPALLITYLGCISR